MSRPRSGPRLAPSRRRRSRAPPRRPGPCRRRCAPRPRRRRRAGGCTGEASKTSTPAASSRSRRPSASRAGCTVAASGIEGAAAEGGRGAAGGDLLGVERARPRPATPELAAGGDRLVPGRRPGRGRSRPGGSRRGGTRRRRPPPRRTRSIPATASLGGAGDRQRRLVAPALAHVRQREPHHVAEAAVAAARPVPAASRPRAGRRAPRAPAPSGARPPTSPCSRRRPRRRRRRARRRSGGAGVDARRPPRASSRVACASSPLVSPKRGAGRRLEPMPSGQDSTPYVDALLAYAARDPGRFQVPGHKGGPGADPALRELVGEVGLRNDIPSITEGVDIGPEPTPFQQAQLLAAEAWGARRTWFLINGASQGNHADLPRARPRRQAGRRPAQRPLLGDRRPGAERDAADLRRAGARPRAGDRPLPDAGLAGRGARRDARRGRGDGRLADLLRRLRRRRRPRRPSPTSAACRWSSTRPGAPTCASTPTCPPTRSAAAPTSSSPRPTRSSAA